MSLLPPARTAQLFEDAPAAVECSSRDTACPDRDSYRSSGNEQELPGVLCGGRRPGSGAVVPGDQVNAVRARTSTRLRMLASVFPAVANGRENPQVASIPLFLVGSGLSSLGRWRRSPLSEVLCGDSVQRSLRCIALLVAALMLCGTPLVGTAVDTASAASAKSKQRAAAKKRARVRRQLRAAVKRNPGVVRRRSFLRKAALVNFKLPVTIRLRNPCSEETGQNPRPTVGGTPTQSALSQNCLAQGTALNQRSIPSANVTRSVARDAAGRARRRAGGGRRVQRHL